LWKKLISTASVAALIQLVCRRCVSCGVHDAAVAVVAAADVAVATAAVAVATAAVVAVTVRRC
jgi:hypothetical protein